MDVWMYVWSQCMRCEMWEILPKRCLLVCVVFLWWEGGTEIFALFCDEGKWEGEEGWRMSVKESAVGLPMGEEEEEVGWGWMRLDEALDLLVCMGWDGKCRHRIRVIREAFDPSSPHTHTDIKQRRELIESGIAAASNSVIEIAFQPNTILLYINWQGKGPKLN